MRIKATGTVLENKGDGKTIKVAWDPISQPRDWYFYTYRGTLVEADSDSENGKRLVDFTFHGAQQDYEWWLQRPYWVEKYGGKPPVVSTASLPIAAAEDDETDDEEEGATYSLQDIVAEGCFLSEEELAPIMERWREKKNLILQGPPGTGKTWLAKRLGFALIGSKGGESQSRLRIVQFHPTLSYEDFVRGYRPNGDGKLMLTDGILMQAIEAAKDEADREFVLVIEEINRGSPAQIFGEMLTLIEASKRKSVEAMELAYRAKISERVYVPGNLHIIGTMNVADRSLAIVDLALRRRFAFVDLEPTFNDAWHAWCRKRGLDGALLTEIQARLGTLNEEIAAAASLGPQFRIGHSYVTPEDVPPVADGRAWFRARVTTEIGPLLDEYWYDTPETAKAARAKLLANLE